MSQPTPLEVDQAAQEIRQRYEACRGQLDGGGLPIGMAPDHRADVAWLLLVIDQQREQLKAANHRIVEVTSGHSKDRSPEPPGADGTPGWAYDEDGHCVCCGNGRWKLHMPDCELRGALDLRR